MAKKKQRVREWGDWAAPFAITIATFGVTYILASWAIDSGRISVYILAFIAFYFGAHYLKETIKNFLK